jgi:hypothetical protein
VALQLFGELRDERHRTARKVVVGVGQYKFLPLARRAKIRRGRGSIGQGMHRID